MPRYQPPKNYYTATEVKKILGISGAMIANYVSKDKIKHFVPPGRKHGFYLKEDVDKLASELQAFFDLGEDVEVATFLPAKVEDLPQCIALNRELFPTIQSADDDTLIKRWSGWIEKNPETVYVLKQEGKVIGIATMLALKPHSQRFEKALREDTSFLLGDVNISKEDIEEYVSGNHVQIYISEIGVKPSLNKNLRRRHGAMLIAKFMDTIINLGRRGINIERMTSVGASRSGVKLLQHFGFTETLLPVPDTRFFVLNMKESGAPMVKAYREALQAFTDSEWNDANFDASARNQEQTPVNAR